MSIYEIERRLRMAAPDEPAVLPPLLLLVETMPSAVGGPEIKLRPGRDRRRTPVTVRLAWVALLMLGIVAGALATGALRLEQLTGPLPVPGLYAANGIALDYPATWTRITPPNGPFGGSGASVGLLASSHRMDGCAPDSEAVARNSSPPQPEPSDGHIDGGYQQGTIYSMEDRQYACLIEQAMLPGEARLIVSNGAPQIIGVGPFGDFASLVDANPGPTPIFSLPSAANGFTESIDGMPAKLVVHPASVVPDADELRTWLIARPGGTSELVVVQVVLRGPDLDAMRDAADDIARSLRFDSKPPTLAEAELDAALKVAIDSRDREMRQYPGATFLGCMPRTVGEQTATIVDGPAGLLPEPAEVTCSVTAEATEVGVWRVHLTVAWPANGDAPAERWVRELLVFGDGTVQGEGDVAPGTGEPLPFPGQSAALPPLGDPPTFAPGDLVRVLPPGSDEGFYDVDTVLLPPGDLGLMREAGAYLIIVSGPERFDDRDWYIADAGDERPGWVAASAKGRPLLEPVIAPVCPASVTNVLDVAYLPIITQRLCAGPDALTFGPVQVGDAEMDGSGLRPAGDPDWLVGGATIQLFGEGGPSGLDRGLPAVVAPSAAELPRGKWITVSGHYDDPAAADCSWTYPPEWEAPAEPSAVQTRRCAERFVVTGFVPAEAP